MIHCRAILLMTILVVAGSFTSGSGQIPYEKYQLSWADEFDVDGLPNSDNWGYEVGCSVRNNELQYYANADLDNSRIEDGHLIIEARKESKNGCEYTSANLVTTGKKTFKYGLFELRAKIDIRSGSWPAWWWLPNSGGWPKGGEIDMMEFYRGKLLFNVMDGNQRWTSVTRQVSEIGGSDWADEFHVWTWEWDSLEINLWLDGTLMNHYLVSNADNTGPNGENPFRRPGYMLVNQAIGGNNGGDPAGTEFPVKYIVDYIRYYQPGKDSVAPEVVSVSGSNGGAVTVIFSEKVDSVSAGRIDNYAIDVPDVELLGAELQSDGRTVIINASGLILDATHTLTVKNIADCAIPANTMGTVSKEFTVRHESVKLTGTVIGSGSPYHDSPDVTYDKAVDGNTSTFSDCTGDPVWVGYDFGDAPPVITGLRFFPRSGYPDRMSGKSFEVSSDNETWQKIYTITSAPSEGEFTTVTVDDTEPVRFVRYNGSGGYLNVCEVEFRGFPHGTSDAKTTKPNRSGYPAIKTSLQPPFKVRVYTPDGRLVAAWATADKSSLHDIGPLLTNCAAQGLLIVTVSDKNRILRQFTMVSGK